MYRNGAIYAILKQKLLLHYKYAYLSAQASPLSAFMIRKTHIVAQKPRGKQLNAKVYSVVKLPKFE